VCRPATSGVSALSGCVAKGHQALHYVSSSPSKIPYGGFSPVRLQTASLHRNLRHPGQPGSLYAVNGPVGLRLLSARTVSGWRETAPDPAVQRPLARRRVILSRQVMAYYGLIRASRSLSPSYVLRRRVFACRPGPRGSPIYSACPFCPCRLQYPGGSVGGHDCWISVRASLHPMSRGSASASAPRQSVRAWSGISGLQSSLYAAARPVARPPPT
jgi:hypothetical protein